MINEKTTKAFRELLGELIQKQREDIGMSRNKVASHCGLHPAQVKSVEDGSKSYTIDTLARIAYGMNCQLFIELRPKDTDRDTHDWEKLTGG